nr:response regulator [uncultured Dyadobacter sp.]
MPSYKTIYIVDDDPDDIFLIQQAITELQLDVQVLTALNGMQLVKNLNPDTGNCLVLIDMNMPVMNGIETLEALYAEDRFRNIRSILMSTSNAAELSRLALNAGAMKFICKPCHYDGYLRLLKEIYDKCF